MESWSEHFQLTKNYPPNPMLEKAIPFAPSRQHALDLGAGSLKDTKYLLSMGFRHVTAIDGAEASKQFAKGIPKDLLKLQIKKFEEIKRLPANYFDLINASFSLPFITPPHLPYLVDQIIKALKPNGIFSGQFFGPEDDWNKPKNKMSFTDRPTLEKLLSSLKLIHFTETQPNGKTSDGKAKHWHLFNVIAQK